MESGLEDLKKACRLGDTLMLQDCISKSPNLINECDPVLG